ncbi:sigma factor-like helix-turn-helix DNA-binding protein [Streptomyces sp. NPDC049097]|uniref:sigma factor-like helix-turn-helix DNA-binding protein n=1 Tax=Streptomyces sp. NPDC049097 TaxID=3155497 RepID=UPI0034245347
MEGSTVMQSTASQLPRPKECRRLRRSQSLTQTQAAAALGVSLEEVRDWETGLTEPHGRRRRAYARLLAEWAAHERTEGSARDWTTTRPLTPHQAFDGLYEFCAPALVRQAYLLTGRPGLAREAVEHAFQLAWQRWPEVALDRDPPSWVRAAAHDWALSPRHRFRLRHRRSDAPADPDDRALLDALLTLPPIHRRTLVLHDGAGLGLPETAAETEASTAAATARLQRARETMSDLVPDQAAPEVLPDRMADLAMSVRLRAARPPAVRSVGERKSRHGNRMAVLFTAALVGATALTLNMATDHYERPVPEGTTVLDLPPRVAMGPLSTQQQRLRLLLKKQAHKGPARLVPQVR